MRKKLTTILKKLRLQDGDILVVKRTNGWFPGISEKLTEAAQQAGITANAWIVEVNDKDDIRKITCPNCKGRTNASWPISERQ